MVYARELDDDREAADGGKKRGKKGEARKITLFVSGQLWNRSLVMQDKETGSLWSHILGECMAGPLKGSRLEALPAEMVTWKSWKDRYPKSTVLNLPRTRKEYDKSFYERQLKWVYGIVIDGEAMAYPFGILRTRKFFQNEVGSEPVVVTFDPESTRASIYSRRLGRKEEKRLLSFELDPASGALRDTGTRSLWNPATGRCTAGRLKGKKLRVLPGIVSFEKAWRTFHPESGYAKEK